MTQNWLKTPTQTFQLSNVREPFLPDISNTSGGSLLGVYYTDLEKFLYVWVIMKFDIDD